MIASFAINLAVHFIIVVGSRVEGIHVSPKTTENVLSFPLVKGIDEFSLICYTQGTNALHAGTVARLLRSFYN